MKKNMKLKKNTLARLVDVTDLDRVLGGCRECDNHLKTGACDATGHVEDCEKKVPDAKGSAGCANTNS